jgi:hypothetical protein
MSDYPYWALVLIDRPDGARLSKGAAVVVGGPLRDGDGVWVCDPDQPDLPWAITHGHIMGVDGGVNRRIPHAGETFDPFLAVSRGSGWKGGGK